MKALFEALKRKSLADKGLILLDTCFFVWAFERQREKDLDSLCAARHVAITSFNAEEFLHLHHKFTHIEPRVRDFLKAKPFSLLAVPVHPGDREAEAAFMRETDPYLPQHVKDNSDGVLLAAAIRTRSSILSRDRHDVFNTELENFLQRYGIQVKNEFKGMLNYNRAH